MWNYLEHIAGLIVHFLSFDYFMLFQFEIVFSVVKQFIEHSWGVSVSTKTTVTFATP